MERESEMYFAQFLKQKRNNMGLTQEELATKVHVSKSAITKWEAGRGIPDRTNLRELSEVLGTPVDFLNRLIEGNNQPNLDSGFMEDVISLLESYGYTVMKKED